ncbi:unnamed protein product [Alternaria alternata]
MSSHPSVVLIPGSFCPASMYDPLITPLRARGYDIHILEPPCYPAGYHASSGTGHPSMYDDAKYINDFVMKLANDGNEVVVIAHSYGDPAAVAAICFNNLTLEEGLSYVAKFGKHYSACFGDAITHPGYKDIPVSWLFAAEDLIILPEVQQTAIDVIEGSWVGTEREGRKVDVTRVVCDHFPLVLDEKRKQVSEWIEGAVAKGGCE